MRILSFILIKGEGILLQFMGNSLLVTLKKLVSVPVVRLDDELKRRNITSVNFIKMDIKGAELEALDGCSYLLLENSVDLVIASYHSVNGSKTYKCVEKNSKDWDMNVKPVSSVSTSV